MSRWIPPRALGIVLWMDQRWVLALPILVGVWLVGGGLLMYSATGERWLMRSLMLRAFGPGVITAPIGVGISCLLLPVAYAVWPVEWARNTAMTLLITSLALSLLSFGWSPKWLLPKWLRPHVRTPS